jgi:hypothetical protein
LDNRKARACAMRFNNPCPPKPQLGSGPVSRSWSSQRTVVFPAASSWTKMFSRKFMCLRRGRCPYPPAGAKLRRFCSMRPQTSGELRSPARTRASGPTWFVLAKCFYQLLQTLADRREVIFPTPLSFARGELGVAPLHLLLEVHTHAGHYLQILYHGLSDSH